MGKNICPWRIRWARRETMAIRMASQHVSRQLISRLPTHVMLPHCHTTMTVDLPATRHTNHHPIAPIHTQAAARSPSSSISRHSPYIYRFRREEGGGDGWIEAISCSKKEGKSGKEQGDKRQVGGEAAFRMNFLNPHV